MENAYDKTPIKDNEGIITFHRPKESLLERSQSAMLYVMDECGDDVMDVMQQEICNLADIPGRTYRDNFPGFDAFLYCSTQEIINGIAGVAEIIAKYNDSHEEPAEKKQVVFWLLKWHCSHPISTEFGLRRFGINFWRDALKPVLGILITMPSYYTDRQKAYIEKDFSASYIIAVSDWMENGFDPNRMDAYGKMIIARARQISPV